MGLRGKGEGVCRYCDKEIVRAKYPERVRGRIWGWCTKLGGWWYCPQAGGECEHYPKDEGKADGN